ncbi:unnamed protein product [Didymodactylos carnosus]|uniref:F-box domain-containing protein n=1 Tax=Didymodactylos carnosus TaxID=1234261 RepID=A0A815AG11_9BILA|nr:unnamed protein product [Didymodactylos carnosus]CAF1254149.1 unnamed protein product [Didymodactylos carnosus]CAF3827764.1 unnamed protein product [Didymodactylos carnosus]CAF4025418.1 unnamed protein product [Didymodactylos carnosus]
MNQGQKFKLRESHSDDELGQKRFKHAQEDSKPTTTFNDLCTDIVYELFEYVNVNELYQSFYTLTSQMKHTIDTYFQPLYVDLSESISFNYFFEFIEPTLFDYPKQFFSLKLSAPVDRRHLILTKLTHFRSLTVLTLVGMDSKDMIPILKVTPHLTYLNIDNSRRRANVLIDTILKIQTLKTFIFRTLTHITKLPLTTATSNIERLSTSLNIDSLRDLICHLPKIRYLQISLCYRYSTEGELFDVPLMPSLVKLKIICTWGFVTSFAKHLFKTASSLQYLHLVGAHFSAQYLDPSYWTNLLSSVDGQVEHIKLHIGFSPRCIGIRDRNEIVEKFKTSTFMQQHDIQIYDKNKEELCYFRIIADYQNRK